MSKERVIDEIADAVKQIAVGVGIAVITTIILIAIGKGGTAGND